MLRFGVFVLCVPGLVPLGFAAITMTLLRVRGPAGRALSQRNQIMKMTGRASPRPPWLQSSHGVHGEVCSVVTCPKSDVVSVLFVILGFNFLGH